MMAPCIYVEDSAAKKITKSAISSGSINLCFGSFAMKFRFSSAYIEFKVLAWNMPVFVAPGAIANTSIFV